MFHITAHISKNSSNRISGGGTCGLINDSNSGSGRDSR